MSRFRKADDFLSVTQAAEELGISRSKAYRLIEGGHLKVSWRPTGGRNGAGEPRMCVPRTEIDRFLGTLGKVRKATA